MASVLQREVVQLGDIAERRRRYLLRYSGMVAERSRQWIKWGDLAAFIMPERGRFLTSDHNRPKDTSKILNNQPTRMARGLAAGLMSGCTPRARPWLEHTIPDEDLAKWGPVKMWLWEYTRRMRKITEMSGFYPAMSQCVYPDIATFGLGSCIQEEDPVRVMRFVPLTIGSYCLAQNGKQEIDAVMYEEPWTVGALVKEFSWEKVSDSVRVAWNAGNYEQYFTILRVIAPNEEFVPGGFGRRGMRWGSAWMEMGGTGAGASAMSTQISSVSAEPNADFLRESGYEEFPLLCARWATTASDVYPTGPGHDALPDCKQLMKLESRSLLSVSKGVNPSMLIPESMRALQLSMLPGDPVYVPGGTTQKIEPAFVPHHEYIDKVEAKIRQAELRISEAYFGDLMRQFTEEVPGRGRQPPTAEEIVAQKQEILLLLGPVLDNVNEFLTSYSNRTHHIMLRKRLIPPAPREIHGMQIVPRFISVLFQAQKMIGVQARERALAFTAQLAQVKGEDATDLLDADKMGEGYYDEIGLPPDCMVPLPVRQQTRQARAAQKQAMAQGQAMLAATEGAKNLAKANTGEGGGDNLLTRMLGPMAGAQAGGGV
jgi:hypothetical protein